MDELNVNGASPRLLLLITVAKEIVVLALVIAILWLGLLLGSSGSLEPHALWRLPLVLVGSLALGAGLGWVVAKYLRAVDRYHVLLLLGIGLVAAELSRQGLMHLVPLRDELLLGLAPGFVLGDGAPRLPNTLAVGFDGVSGQELVSRASARGVCISAGAACHGQEPVPPAALLAMGMAPADALRMVRLSLGWSTTAAEVRQARERLLEAVVEARRAA